MSKLMTAAMTDGDARRRGQAERMASSMVSTVLLMGIDGFRMRHGSWPRETSGPGNNAVSERVHIFHENWYGTPADAVAEGYATDQTLYAAPGRTGGGAMTSWLCRLVCAVALSVVAIGSGCTTASPAAPSRAMIDLSDRAAVRSAGPILIAHRGGVIGPASPECSLAAIRLAADHGYHMVELDVQATRDHQPVLFHDETLRRACAVDARVAALTLTQISTVRFRQSEQTIATLDEALALCRSLGLGVMLDFKLYEPPDEAMLARVAELIDQYGLGHATMTITSDPRVAAHLAGRAMFVADHDTLRRVERGESVELTGQFWFGIPEDLPPDLVQPLQRRGALVVPAINTFRYPPHAHEQLARADVADLVAAGVDGFQIDSTYRALFAERGRASEAMADAKSH